MACIENRTVSRAPYASRRRRNRTDRRGDTTDPDRPRLVEPVACRRTKGDRRHLSHLLVNHGTR
jgi:hypothetical protein